VRRRSAGAVATVLGVIAATLGACGVPNDGEPRGIASDDVPAGLLAPPTTRPVAPEETGPPLFPTTQPVSTATIRVFLVIADRDRVYPVERRAPPPPETPSVLSSAQAAADLLLQSPLPVEEEAGYTTTLLTTTIRCLRVDEVGTLDIEVAQLPSIIADQPLAMAQIILTLTRVGGVNRVRVFRDNEFFRVPLWAGGESEPGVPVDFSDYFSAVGSPGPPATTTTVVPTTVAATTAVVPVDSTTAVPVDTTGPPAPEQTPATEPAPPAEEGTPS
jgi:hypothetical protein